MRGLEKDSILNLGTAESPLYIDVNVCRAVVRHTNAWRLQNHKNRNCRGEFHGNVEGDVTDGLNQSLFAPSTALARRGCLASNLLNAEFGLCFVLDSSKWA